MVWRRGYWTFIIHCRGSFHNLSREITHDTIQIDDYCLNKISEKKKLEIAFDIIYCMKNKDKKENNKAKIVSVPLLDVHYTNNILCRSNLYFD